MPVVANCNFLRSAKHPVLCLACPAPDAAIHHPALGLSMLFLSILSVPTLHSVFFSSIHFFSLLSWTLHPHTYTNTHSYLAVFAQLPFSAGSSSLILPLSLCCSPLLLSCSPRYATAKPNIYPQPIPHPLTSFTFPVCLHSFLFLRSCLLTNSKLGSDLSTGPAGDW